MDSIITEIKKYLQLNNINKETKETKETELINFATNVYNEIDITNNYPLLTLQMFINIFNKIIIVENNVIKLNSLIDYIQLNPNQYNYGLYCDTVLPLYINIEFTEQQLNNWCSKVKELQQLPQYVQRSAQWYKQREQCISASDIASAIGESKYNRQNSIILQKCGFPSEFKGNIYTMHGQTYEDIAILLYQKIYKVKVFEFGLIPHGHIKSHSKERVSFVGASPDGITENGIMLEIKCPVTRKVKTYNVKKHKFTTGDKTIVPHDYFVQMQTQLEACDLEICDFVECEISEYPSDKEYYEETDTKIKGIIIYNNETEKYIYPSELYNTESEWKKWVSNVKKRKGNGNIKVVYFKINNFEIFRVYRDQEYFKEKLVKITEFWNKVLECRENTELLEPFLEERNKETEETNMAEQRQQIQDLCKTKCFL